MITGYQSGLRSMVGSIAYSLTQRSSRMATRRAVVCSMTRQLARQGTRRAVPYKVSNSLYERYAILSLRTNTFSLFTLQLWSSNLTVEEPIFKNNSGGRSHSFYAAARTLPSYCPVPAHISTARLSQLSILDFSSTIYLTHYPTIGPINRPEHPS